MKVLPALTEAPPRLRRRRHRPKRARGKKGYRQYKECLRWEFAFSCAFCLLHEADLGQRPPEMRRGRRDFDVEHRVPQSKDPRRRNDYNNVYYCCAPCNAARSSRDVKRPEGKLLDPCRVGWGSRFIYVDFRLQPRKTKDRDAVRTINTYDLNSDEKVAMRRTRSMVRTLAERRWREVHELLERLQERWSEQDPEALEIERSLSEYLDAIVTALRGYRAIPIHASTACRCAPPRSRLPRWLDAQCADLPL